MSAVQRWATEEGGVDSPLLVVGVKALAVERDTPLARAAQRGVHGPHRQRRRARGPAGFYGTPASRTAASAARKASTSC
jgi:hypothetical protein